MAETSCGVYSLVSPAASTSMRATPPSPLVTVYGTVFISSETSENCRPMNRFTEAMVLAGLVMACRLAGAPTRRSPSFLNATTEGVVRPPSALGTTTGSLPSMTATTELVVPRSMPMILPIGVE